MRIAFCCVFHERTVTDKLYSELFVYAFGQFVMRKTFTVHNLVNTVWKALQLQTFGFLWILWKNAVEFIHRLMHR